MLFILLHASNAKIISSSFAIPVDNIMGFPLDATYSIKGISVISNEAILYAGVFKSSKKSTAVLSKGDEKHIKFSFWAASNKSLCHSQGV